MEVWHYWIILGIILLICEIFTPGFFLASFGIGAFGSSLFAFFGFGLKVQLIVFSIITMVVFFGIRPFFLKYFSKYDDQRETGVNALIGKNYKVTETINNAANTGRIQIGSESWLARSEADVVINEGETVTVFRIEGSTAYVLTNGEGGSKWRQY